MHSKGNSFVNWKLPPFSKLYLHSSPSVIIFNEIKKKWKSIPTPSIPLLVLQKIISIIVKKLHHRLHFALGVHNFCISILFNPTNYILPMAFVACVSVWGLWNVPVNADFYIIFHLKHEWILIGKLCNLCTTIHCRCLQLWVEPQKSFGINVLQSGATIVGSMVWKCDM